MCVVHRDYNDESTVLRCHCRAQHVIVYKYERKPVMLSHSTSTYFSAFALIHHECIFRPKLPQGLL